MPRWCTGFDMDCGSDARPCMFALDGLGQTAQIKSTSDKCIFCSPEGMRKAVATPQGFGSVVRALKKWRGMSSPVYDLAFEHSSLTTLPATQLEALRGNSAFAVRKSNREQPENPKLWFWANFRMNGGFYGDNYANAVLREYSRLQNEDPFIEDAFLRGFHKSCPTCGKSFRGHGHGYCPTATCRELLEANRNRRKSLKKWLMKRVEGDISMGPPFNDELCAWASREGYFERHDM
ncbi:unnamed protein product [Symbiodinium natans]|uniref:GYF domain-containing protein n=1 Tax=Symbiodinium natans TaxID=878477 RepID=A0A812MEV5_9DINO|nr:unnamed protein product [Symbiodinium natans]CAE7261175.1 unnamed protein product [Symbiodinium natans]